MRVTAEGVRWLTGTGVILTVVAMGFFGLAAEAEGSGQLAWLAGFVTLFSAVLCGVFAWMASQGMEP